MSARPAPMGPTRPAASAPAVLLPSRARAAPSAGGMARRRLAVAAAKRLLPAAALLLLGVVLLWPEFEGGEERARLSFRRIAQTDAEALRVVAPRYRGIDEQSRPYSVTAATAQQQGAAHRLDLTTPEADLTLADGAWVYLRADAGHYDRPAARLDLAGAVRLHHDNGVMLETAAATIALDAGSAASDTPVAAQGPFGTITGEGFRMTERGTVIIFTGRARAVLEGGR